MRRSKYAIAVRAISVVVVVVPVFLEASHPKKFFWHQVDVAPEIMKRLRSCCSSQQQQRHNDHRSHTTRAAVLEESNLFKSLTPEA